MFPNLEQSPLFTLRADALIGRGTEQQKLLAALEELQQTSDQTLLFYIAGDGGMGKTRLLEWVRDHYSLPSKTFCTTILDFYNSRLRTDVDLVEQIYDNLEEQLQNLSKELTKGFADYALLRDRFRRQELGAVGGQTRTQVIKAFVDAWKPLNDAGYRLIVLLDTAELLRFQDDEVRERFNAPEPVATAKNWIMGVVEDDHLLPGVLFVVAGRKKEAPELYHEISKHAGHDEADRQQWVIDLEGLDLAGVQAYFAELARVLIQIGDTEAAKKVRDVVDAELSSAFYLLTGGSPITLALSLQLFINGQSAELPNLINEQLDQLDAPVADAQPRLQNALVNALANYDTFGTVSIAVRYMAIARKGLTPERLSLLLQTLSVNLPTVDYAALFAQLQKQIYVKQLPDHSLVLHDKVAEWAEAGLYAQDDPIKPYQALVTIYQAEINELNREINRLIPIADPAASTEEFDLSSIFKTSTVAEDPKVVEQAKALQWARRRRRNLVIEQMTYALRGIPERGYRIYYELAEEAFNVGRMDYETQIRSEFLGWWQEEQLPKNGHYKYREQAQKAGLTEELINADFAIRAIQRTYSIVKAGTSLTARSEATIKLANEILRTVAATDNSFTIPLYAQILLNVYADMARGQLATSNQATDEVRKAFTDHIQRLNSLLQERSGKDHKNDLETFLLMSAQAFAYYELGFFESNHGNHGDAVKNFNRSLRPYRELRFEMDQARSLNDKAYSLAITGDSQDADTAVNDALKIRKRLGFSYPIGLSYNTSGIVHTLSERPVSALQNCYNALRIFQALNDQYGQMLAYRAMAEAARRDAERIIDNGLRYQERLLNALRLSESATKLAEELLNDQDATKANVLIEHGSIWRDLARLYWQYPDLKPQAAEEPPQESTKFLERAIAIASAIPRARNELVDAMIDRTYLCYYGIFAPDAIKEDILRQTDERLADVLAEVPAEYRQPNDSAHQTLVEGRSVYWSLLCKAYGLRVTLAREWLKLLRVNDDLQNYQTHEDELLRAAILTLYFRSLLGSNVRNVRRANQVVYEALQTFSVGSLVKFQKRADELTRNLGISVGEHSMLCEYIEDKFGIEHV